MFEQASRLKLRFDTIKGNATTEDLWEIPLTCRSGFSLDDIAKSLNRTLKENEEESFVVKKNGANDILNLKFSIVKHVIKEKLEDIEKAENVAANRAKKEKIIDILADKEDSALKRRSKADLEKMLAEL